MEARKGLVLASVARKFLALLSEDMLQPARLSPGGKKGGAWSGLGRYTVSLCCDVPHTAVFLDVFLFVF